MGYNETMEEPSVEMLVWVHYNRGALTKIAEQAGCSPQFVHMVMRGGRSSASGLVEKLLLERGAPMRPEKPELVS